MDPKRVSLLGIQLDIWKEEDLLNEINKELNTKKSIYIANVDFHKFIHLLRDYTLVDEIGKADINFLEGGALSVAASILKSTNIQSVKEKKFIPRLFSIAEKKNYDILILCESESDIPKVAKHLKKGYQRNHIQVKTYKNHKKELRILNKDNGNHPMMILGEAANPKREIILKKCINEFKNVKLVHGFNLIYDLIGNGVGNSEETTTSATLKNMLKKSPLFWIKYSYTFIEFLLLIFVCLMEEILIPYEILALEYDRGYDLYRLGKRITDIILSFTLLTLGVPLFIIISLLIKLNSKGPIFFTQKRTGYKGREFTILKFRTMKVNAPKYEHSPNCIHDKRLTKVGKYLRKTSLDEIPQFINVLKNDLSIVGPRPEMPFKVKDYTEKERKRLSVKPGVTGLWQLYGDRSKPIHEVLEYDLEYIENRSMWLDIKIILLSFIHIIITPLLNENKWKQW